MKPPHTTSSEKRNSERRRRTNLLEGGTATGTSTGRRTQSQPEGGDPARRPGTQPQPNEGKTTRRPRTEEKTGPTRYHTMKTGPRRTAAPLAKPTCP